MHERKPNGSIVNTSVNPRKPASLQALELLQDLLAVDGGDGVFGEVGEYEAKFVLGQAIGAGHQSVDLSSQVVALGVGKRAAFHAGRGCNSARSISRYWPVAGPTGGLR